MEKLIKHANGQWSIVEESLEKSEVRNAVKVANSKLRAAGIKQGGYGITSHGTPHWDYNYSPNQAKAVENAHAAVEPHLPEGHTHEDYADDKTRHTYGGHPDHVNDTASKNPNNILSTSKKLSKGEELEKEMGAGGRPKDIGMFTSAHMHAVLGHKSHADAKAFAHGVVDASSARPDNKAKAKAMIDSSKSQKHLAIGMSNFTLSAEGLRSGQSRG